MENGQEVGALVTTLKGCFYSITPSLNIAKHGEKVVPV